MQIEPLTPHIGAEIRGVALGAMDDDDMQAIERTLLDWKVIFFRDQDISLAAHKKFARWFGDLEVHPLAVPSQGDTELIRIAEDTERRAHNDIWHTDVTFKQTPPLGSVLRAREMPPVGGDTLFADMVQAYAGLPDKTKARIDGRRARHDFHGFRHGLRAGNASETYIDELKTRYPNPEHPVVRTHPQTGEKCLFVNAAFTTEIVGMDKDESDTLLAELYAQARKPEYQCRFRWRVDSVAFWDNRCTQHYAVADFYPAKRTVERITICGDQPY